MYIIPGGVRKDLPPKLEEKILKLMDYLEQKIARIRNIHS